MRLAHGLAVAAALAMVGSQPAAAIQERPPTPQEDVWKPAATPRGGVS